MPRDLVSIHAMPLWAMLLALFPLAAQAAEPVVPGAGTILQQVQPVTPPVPSSTGTGLTIKQEGGAKLPPTAPFLVSTIQITGNTLFDTATLHALVMDAEGKSLTLSELNDLAARITDYYHSHGYPLARAVIPAQVIQNGRVGIEVIEARYDKIDLDNSSRVYAPLLQSLLSPLQSGQAIDQATLDRTLLLISDVPGIVLNAILKPGETVGTSDLVIETTPGPAVSGSVALDNYGDRYTGRARAGGTVNFMDPLHHGDVLSVSGLSSGSGMNYGRMSYETLLNGQGTRMGGAYSALHYILGDTLAPLNGHGTAEVESLWLKHPFVRSQKANLYGQIQYDHKRLDDRVDANGTQTTRHLDNWTASVSGDSRDRFLSGGVNGWNFGLTSGQIGFDNAVAQMADAATAKTQGGFNKWNANFVRLQNLSPSNGLYINLSGQWANTNLDPAEKMIAGGPYTVRAYDMGVLSGDSGYFGSAEFRHDLGSIWQGQWQAVAFVDSEQVTVNRNTWVAGVNSATLSGVGLGLNWAGPNRWSAKTYLAARIGSAPALVIDSSSARAWIEINKGY